MTFKVGAKQILKEIKEKQTDKKNVTYRLDKTIAADFKETCEKEEVSQAEVLEHLMASFIAECQ